MTARTIAPNALEIAELIGMADAYELLKHNTGAACLYVPLRPTVKHRLTLVVGFAAAQKLADRWGGQILKLPKDRTMVVAARNEKITQLVAEKQNYSVVGRMFGLSRQQVKNIAIGDTAGKRNK